MREYELYVPVNYNDGSPVEPEKIKGIGERLLQQFGGLTFFPQRNEGIWRMGSVTFRDEVVIFRVLTDQVRSARRFFRQFKEELKRELGQEEIIIIERDVETL